MSETPSTDPSTANGAAVPPPPDPQKRIEAEKVLGELLRLMELPGRLELKDAADGGIAVALHVEGEVAGLSGGKRSNVIDSLQFLANKIVNRPNQERRWISIGVNAFPEPRQPKPQRPPPPQAAAAQAVAAPQQQARPQGQQAAAPSGQPPQRPAKQGKAANGAAQTARGPDESTLQVTPDEALAEAIRTLAEKSAKLGRFYAIHPMKVEDRARALKAAEGVPGVKAVVEGEGKLRRFALHPEKPTPMPKRSAMPDYDDEDEDA